MKTNWEKDIKKQLEKRELEVSKAALQRFEEMSQSVKASQKPKLRIVLSVAAAVLLLAGIVSISRYISEGNSEIRGETIATPIVHTEESPGFSEQPQLSKESDSSQRDSDFRQTGPIVREKEKPDPGLPAYKQVESREKLENISFSGPVEAAVIKEKPAEQEDTLTLWEESLLSSSELPKEAETGASYTDPELLLYSVENDDVIKQKRKGARIVLIDFNK